MKERKIFSIKKFNLPKFSRKSFNFPTLWTFLSFSINCLNFTLLTNPFVWFSKLFRKKREKCDEKTLSWKNEIIRRTGVIIQRKSSRNFITMFGYINFENWWNMKMWNVFKYFFHTFRSSFLILHEENRYIRMLFYIYVFNDYFFMKIYGFRF
jgi:hypothetical protein